MLKSSKITAILVSALLICSMAACSAQETKTTADVRADAASALENTVNNGTTLDDIIAQNNGSSSRPVENSQSSDSSGQGSAAASSQNDSTDTSQTSSTGDNSQSSRKNKSSQSTADSTADASEDNGTVQNTAGSGSETQNAAETNVTVSTGGKLDVSDLFSSRDLRQEADLTDASTIQAADNSTQTITEEGVYILTGTASNFTVRVEADKEAKIQLVLDGLNVTNDSFPVIYVVSADKCFITTTNSSNTLSVTGSFTADGDTNTDAVIYSKDDLVFNGVGTLSITSSQGNGISGKDDIKFTGGTYSITSALDSVEANDSISVYDGSFTITSNKDGFHSENSDDDTVGWIFIQNGTFNITAASDAIQATTVAQINGGTLTLNASEGIEATYVQINGGDISITASDDGINGAQKSKSFGTPTIEFNGGNITIVMGQGDTDAVDANGNIVVNGGTINVTAQMSSFDYDGSAQYNGGTIIINGQQVDSIPQSMMGGRGGMNGGFGGRGGMGF